MDGYILHQQSWASDDIFFKKVKGMQKCVKILIMQSSSKYIELLYMYCLLCHRAVSIPSANLLITELEFQLCFDFVCCSVVFTLQSFV